MNLKQLEAFVQVAEGGSFSKAAKQLFLTQPTISAHISSLEKELNARLFVRNTKEVKLSDDGKELYRYARQMIDLQKKIEERFETGKSESKHLITIAASTIPAQYLLPSLAHFPLWRPGHRPASCLQLFLVHRCSAQPPTYRPLRCPTSSLP